jgi:hypothetical protein
LFFGYVALRALRSGESPFFPLARYLTPERDTADQPAGAEAAWGTWLNLRLPDEEDQRAHCRREPLAGGARAERSRRVARREGAGAGVRLVGPGGRFMRGGETSAT